jgi:hypothetical protein
MNTIGPMNSRGQVSADREDIRSRLNDQSLGGLDAKAVPQSSWKDFKNYFGKRRNFLALLGTAGSWFFLDVAYYALLLNNVLVLQKLGFGAVSHETEHSIYTLLRNGAVGNLVLVVAGAIPGSILAIILVDKIGRKPIQIAGFFMMTLLLLILGSAFNSISDSSRVALFVLVLFFVNFGKCRAWETPGNTKQFFKVQIRQLSLCLGNASPLDTEARLMVYQQPRES